jgi:hypothetical protein
VNALFLPEDREEACRLLVEECADNLPLSRGANAYSLERLRYAALKLSEGDLDRLREAVALAQTDWRDLLMAAGFGGTDHAHKRWWPKKSRQDLQDQAEESSPS